MTWRRILLAFTMLLIVVRVGFIYSTWLSSEKALHLDWRNSPDAGVNSHSATQIANM